MEAPAFVARKPHTTIRPSSGWSALNLAEVWHFRDLLLSLAGRDLKVRYKQTALGVLWVVLQPLLAAGVFAFVFGSVAKLEAPGEVPYFLFSFVGLMAWTAFSGTLSRVSNSMVSNAHMVSKIYFPRLVLPLSNVFAAVVDFSVAFGLLAILLILTSRLPATGFLLIPALLTVLLMLAIGLGLIAAAVAVRYRDMIYVLPVMTQFLLYASPVAYATAEVPEVYRTIYYLNPIVGILEAFRWSVLGVGDPSWGWLLYSTGAACVLFVVGAVLFKRMERMFADVI